MNDDAGAHQKTLSSQVNDVYVPSNLRASFFHPVDKPCHLASKADEHRFSLMGSKNKM